MDNTEKTQDLLQVERKLVDDLNLYKDALDSTNTLSKEHFGPTSFDAYDKVKDYESSVLDTKKQKRLQLEAKITDMILIDEEMTSTPVFKDRYRGAWELAQQKRASLQTDANRSGMDKVKNDLTGRKKEKAKKKLEELDRAKTVLRDRKTQKLMDEADFEYGELKRSIKERVIHTAKKYFPDETDSEEKIKAIEDDPVYFGKKADELKQEIREKSKDPNNADEVKELTRKWEIFNELSSRENHLATATEKGGAVQIKTFKYMMDPEERELTRATDRILEAHKDKFNTGDLKYNDIKRDVCRWSQPMGQGAKATVESTGEAYTHLAELVAVEEKPAADFTFNEKRDRVGNIYYLYGKLTLFTDEIDEFTKTCPPSIFSETPDYVDIISCAEQLNAFYKKSQTLAKLGNLIRLSPAYTYVPDDMKERIERTCEKVHMMLSVSSTRLIAGEKWDQLKKKTGALPPAGSFTVESADSIIEKFDQRLKEEKEHATERENERQKKKAEKAE